jgi:hypothetical protein
MARVFPKVISDADVRKWSGGGLSRVSTGNAAGCS